MKKIDEAIEAADEGDTEKAGEQLSETLKRIDEKVGGEKHAEAMLQLNQLADQLGAELNTEDRDDRDD